MSRICLPYLIVLIPLVLSGCGKPVAKCTSEEGIELVGQIVSEQAEKILAENKFDDGTFMFDKAKIRATLDKIQITIESIRTSKEDPSSTKVFCEGEIKLIIPADMLNSAEKGKELSGGPKLSKYAESLGFDSNANAFSKKIEYNVQPTDDGKKIFAELENVAPMADLLDEVVAAALLKPLLESRKAEQAAQEIRFKVGQAAQDEQLKAEQAQQLAEQKQANLGQAQADNALANQTINEVWKLLPENVRQLLLIQQRAWIKKKEIDCKLEAAGKSTDTMERETARLICDSNVTNARINELRQQL